MISQSLKIKKLGLLLFLLLFACGCKRQENSSQKMDYEQGITGKITWEEGNMMPGIGRERPAPQPIEREVLVYKLTKMDQGVRNGSLYQSVKTEQIASAKSDENGVYRIGLPPGTYSVFVKEEEGLFANRFDGQGYVNPVEVEEGAFSKLDITVNYKAAY